MTEKELRKLAKKRAQAKRGVLVHFIICFAVSIFLIFIHATTSNDYNGYFWPVWPIGGMILSVVIHAGVVFADIFNFEASVEKEYQKLKAANGQIPEDKSETM